MAQLVSITNLTSGADIDGNSTAATASISPASNNLILVAVNSRTNITADPNQATLTGNGLTWVAIATIVWDTTSASRKRITLFRGLGASPTSGAISIDFGGQNQTDVDWVVDQAAGIDTSGANGAGAVVQSATNKDETATSPTLTVTLGAFSNTNNATYGVLASDGSHTLSSVGAGFSQLATNETQGGGSGIDIVSEWKVSNDTTVDATFSANAMLGGIAIEIKAEVIGFDAVSNSGYQTASASYSWNHTTNGANRYLEVDIAMLSVAGSSVTSITYGGVAMTFLGAKASASGAVSIEMWGLINPTIGTNSIAVTLSTGLDSIGSAISLDGVHQVSPTEGFNSASATNIGAADAIVNVTTVADNDWVIGAVASSDTSITANQTSRNNTTGTLGSGADETTGR